MKKFGDLLPESSRKAHRNMFKAAAKKKHDADEQAAREKRLKAKGWVRNDRGGMSKVETTVEIEEGRNDVVKALADKAKTGGIDKADFKKAHDLYKAAKLQDLKKLIKGLDTDVAEYIADVISRHDSKAFNSMYPKAKAGDYLSKIIREDLDEAKDGVDQHPEVRKRFDAIGKTKPNSYERRRAVRAFTNKKKELRREKEEVELDEISPKLARKAAAASQAKSFEYGSSAYGPGSDKETDRLDKKSDKAMAHVQKRQGAKGVRKTNRLAGKLIYGKSRAFAEDAQDEKRMMRGQLMFMAYAAKEIAAYLDRINDPEEWYQNKMATTHSMMKTLYSYAQGQMQAMAADRDDIMAGYYGEETQLRIDGRTKAFREKLRKLAYEKYGKKKVDAIDKEEKNEAMSLRDIKNKKERDEKNKDKKSGNRYRDMKKKVYGNMMGGLKEEVELDEANFKPGTLKLKDGSKVKLSMDDAKAIATVMKTLNPKNRKEMETRLMADKKGFDEIMAFVQAAGV